MQNKNKIELKNHFVSN